MSASWQTVRVVHKDGQTTHGIDTGSDVWWHCVCGHRLPLLGTPGRKPTPIACPGCRRKFELPAREAGKLKEDVREI